MIWFTVIALICEIIGTVGGFGSSVFFVPVAQFFFSLKIVLGLTAILHVFSNLSKIFYSANTLIIVCFYCLEFPAPLQ